MSDDSRIEGDHSAMNAGVSDFSGVKNSYTLARLRQLERDVSLLAITHAQHLSELALRLDAIAKAQSTHTEALLALQARLARLEVPRPHETAVLRYPLQRGEK